MLREAIESVLAQTFSDIETVIVLNGATADTVEMANRFRATANVRAVEMGRSTLPAARNFGMTFATGEWIAFLDDDDIWLPQKIEAQVAAARQTGADLVTCDYVMFTDRGEMALPGLPSLPHGLSFSEALMLGNCVSGGSAAMVKAAAIRSLGGFDEQLYGCEDWDMWRRLSWDHQIHRVDQPLVRYRRHRENLTGDPILMFKAQARHFIKLLEDTPAKLNHMLPEAKRQYLEMARANLSVQLPESRYHEQIIKMLLLRKANELSFGMAGKAWRMLKRLRMSRLEISSKF